VKILVDLVKELRTDIKARAEERRQRVASDLAILIAKAGLKRKDVAQLLEITESALSIRLNGKTNLTLDSIGGICDATGYDFDVHFRRAEEAPVMSFWEFEEVLTSLTCDVTPGREILKKEVHGEAWLEGMLNKNFTGVLGDIPNFKLPEAANERLTMKYESESAAA
jgi:transcriptional regulator with XRE-family HTH domain